MEIKAGYKQTEVGIIPEDWEVKPLGRLVLSVEYGSSAKSSTQGQMPVLRMGNLQDGKIDWNDLVYTSNEFEINKYQLRPGNVLFNRTNTIDLVGKTSIYDGERPAIFAGYLIRINVDKSLLNSQFLNYILNTEFSRKYSSKVLSVAVGQANINAQKLKTYPIPLPPNKDEQDAIAQALSDTDALIEALEQLLTKKRQVKQGAMQELLRVKDNWASTNLGSIADPNKRWSYTGGPFGSNLKASDYTDDGIRVIQLQNIGDGEFKPEYEVFTSKQKADELLSCNIYPGEIILSKMGDPVARACIIPSLHERYVMCSDGIRLAVDQKRFSTYFVYTVINAKDFRTKAENAGVGSTRKRIGLTELRSLELFCPPLPEQTAIAEILSDMDAEIATLEGKLSKARQVKQGMMQELLTGRIRLI
ncbi:MAG TPA: restriction endonuclease subunit S [Anaerolineales bacterium]|nr:restriction endonuclease subunit S [Anaerolineales bacterium]